MEELQLYEIICQDGNRYYMDIKYFYVYDYQIKKPIGKLVLNQNNGVPIKNEQGQYIKQDNNIDSLIRKI